MLFRSLSGPLFLKPVLRWLEVVVFTFGDQHPDGTAEIHQEASDMDVPKFRVPTGVASVVAVLNDCISQALSVFTVFFLFRHMSIDGIRVFKVRAKKMRVSSTVAMLHDVHVANVVQLHSDIKVLKENVPPCGMSRLHHTKRSSCEHELIIAVLQIVAFHECASVIDQPQIHATEQQYVFPRCGIWASLNLTASRDVTSSSRAVMKV